MTPLADLLGSHTVQTVLMGAAILGATSGLLGCFALLRRQSLLGDAVAHAALPGICLGFLIAGSRTLEVLLAGALVSGGIAALVAVAVARGTRLKTDAALGIVLSTFFAAGVVLLTLAQARGGAAQAGLSSFLFGEAAAILRRDVWVIGTLGALACGLVLLLWKEFKLITFDPDFARVQGMPVRALEALLTVVIALAIVVGLQMVGVVLMVAMLVAPAAAARQWAGSLGAMAVLAAGFGAVSGMIGAYVSAQTRGLSTGPVIVLVATAIVVASILLAPRRGLLPAWAHARARRRNLATERVLLTLYRLARTHDDPAYPAEGGMIDAYHKTDTARALARLAARGLVREVRHLPETTPHWELTEAGRRAAKAAAGRREQAGGAA